jgi:UDP-glucose 4-epimerase
MVNIVIGKGSNLSKELEKNLENVVLISSLNATKELKELDNLNSKINIIFNNFQVSTRLNDLSNPKEYIERSIMTTAEVLDFIRNRNLDINRIIYTSSSSVYGNNEFCKESDPLQPLSLHSSLKISNERLVTSFCHQNNIDYTITRIFNMYGRDDNFSIISKIINSYRYNKTLTIFNNGTATRDFIHIDNVVDIYKKVLNLKFAIPILNIGLGIGISVAEILEFLKEHGIKIETKTKFRDELKKSTADVSKLLSIMGEMEFIKIKPFLLKELKSIG